MKYPRRLFAILIYLATSLTIVIPCGPGYLTPVFEAESAPEVPYTDYAAGRLGVISPKFSRSMLIAAYRHIAGNGLNASEQRALIDVWRAEIDRKDFTDNKVDEAVKTWVAERKKVVSEEKPPALYLERTYGGYDFFPNCTKNAFETAAETLRARVASYGATDANVRNWIEGQDAVFENCSKGKNIPAPLEPGAPQWLQKDRAYQIGAARFYSLDYAAAKETFAEIAQDTESPWKETADYLIARTLIRRASLGENAAASRPLYEEAEKHLEKFIGSGSRFSDSARSLTALVKYRLRPSERVSELAKDITIYAGTSDFRQDVIDYTWLLDKFEADTRRSEERRKEEERSASEPAANVAATNTSTGVTANTSTTRKEAGELEIYVYSVAAGKSWQVFVPPDVSDAGALAAAERVIGQPLSDELKKQVIEGRQQAYQSRYSDKLRSDYEGGYWGEESLKPSLLPAFLRGDEITEWLYLFQMSGTEAYLASSRRFTETGSNLWLMTALAQADKSSAQLPRLMEAADRTDRTGAGYPTIAYHQARLLLALNKQAEARKLVDDMLSLGDALPISAQNSFIALRLKLADTLEDFIRYSLRKPFAFDFSGSISDVEELIAEQKTYFDPEYHKNGREAYEAEIDSQYKEERQWKDRLMFDSQTIEALNVHLPTAALLELYRSPALPAYLRPGLALAIWTRAYLLDDTRTIIRFTPELAAQRPEFAAELEKVLQADTPAARSNALLNFVVNNPILSPFIADGIGKTDNTVEEWGSDD